ncbi:lysylphosphatidylglycerol synthase transmembrane domain-containing protein [Acholeplasma hippikon]|nr:lysylphosphatidylglycerol synthase transmembrane domain-containing protein [Acholeplasma hippikon]
MQEQQSNKKIWLNIVMVVVIILAGLTIIGSLHDFELVLEKLKTMKLPYYLGALGLSLVGLVLITLSNLIVQRAINKDLPMKTGFFIQSVEPFFNGITPFSSGAQPFQVYFYRKHHLKPEQATSIVLVVSILYQIACVALSLVGLILFFNQITSSLGLSFIFLMIGIFINAFVLVLLFLMAYVKGFKNLIYKLLMLLSKIKFLKKKMEQLMEKSDKFVHNFQKGVKFLFTKKRVFIGSLSTKFAALFITYLTTILIAKALGATLTTSENFYLVFTSLLAATSMFFVPLPGASGGTEAIFAGMIGAMFESPEIAISLMILWRVATYYFGMLYGFVSYLILQKMKVKEV